MRRRGSITDAEALLKKLKYEVDLLQKTLRVMVRAPNRNAGDEISGVDINNVNAGN